MTTALVAAIVLLMITGITQQYQILAAKKHGNNTPSSTHDGTKAPPTSSDVIPISPSKVAVGNPLAAAPAPTITTTTPTPTPSTEFPLPPTVPARIIPNGEKQPDTNTSPPVLTTLQNGDKEWRYTDPYGQSYKFDDGSKEWIKIAADTNPSNNPTSTIEQENQKVIDNLTAAGQDQGTTGSSGSSSGSGSTSDRTSGSHGSHSNSGSEKYNGFAQIPSVTTDFPDNDKNAIEVHVTSANKDSIGSYHVRGEIKNLSNDTTLQFVKVTAHLNDESGQPVAVTTCCYADPNDIEPGHTSTFDSFAQKDEISGTPTSYRLSFDWR
jgi:hypothetical protein